MKIVIDTCVLFPTVMREMVLGVARAGVFTPFWSERILEEWRRAAARLGPEGAAQGEAEIALLRAAWPKALRPAAPGLESRLYLPDSADIHVLAVAVDASADAIMTVNAKDFPRNLLAEEGVARVDPDTFLFQAWQANPHRVVPVAQSVLDTARRLSGEDWQMRALMKKARLPRLGRALADHDGG